MSPVNEPVLISFMKRNVQVVLPHSPFSLIQDSRFKDSGLNSLFRSKCYRNKCEVFGDSGEVFGEYYEVFGG